MTLRRACKLDGRMPLFTAAGLLAVGAPVVLGLLHAAQSPAESQAASG